VHRSLTLQKLRLPIIRSCTRAQCNTTSLRPTRGEFLAADALLNLAAPLLSHFGLVALRFLLDALSRHFLPINDSLRLLFLFFKGVLDVLQRVFLFELAHADEVRRTLHILLYSLGELVLGIRPVTQGM
jgi:hypothetical protein